MTEERRGDFLLGALVASIAVHAALMLFMRPQVMTHVTGELASRRLRAPMKVTEAREAQRPVAMDSVADVEAVREAPPAEADAPVPTAPSLAAPEADAAPAPEADAPSAALANAPGGFETVLSEVIHVEAGVSSVTMPILEARIPLSPPSAPAPASAPSASPSVRLAARSEERRVGKEC